MLLRISFLLMSGLLTFPCVTQAQSPLWRVDCDNKDGYWFLMDEKEGSKMPVFIGNSITVIVYPGLHDIQDVHNDARIKWISKDEISVINNDKDAGWKGRLTFYRCDK